MANDEIILSEQNRKKLDGIVSQMIANKESDDNINFVVSDFKTKYGQKKNSLASATPTEGSQPEVPTKDSSPLAEQPTPLGEKSGVEAKPYIDDSERFVAPKIEKPEYDKRDLPKNYLSTDASSYKDLQPGVYYKMRYKKGGKDYYKKWNGTEFEGEIAADKLAEIATQGDARETSQQYIADKIVEHEDNKKEADNELKKAGFLSSFGSVQKLQQLIQDKQQAPPQQQQAIQAQIDELKNLPLTESTFDGTMITGTERKVTTDYLKQGEEYDPKKHGELPIKDMTVGDALAKLDTSKQFLDEVAKDDESINNAKNVLTDYAKQNADKDESLWYWYTKGLGEGLAGYKELYDITQMTPDELKAYEQRKAIKSQYFKKQPQTAMEELAYSGGEFTPAIGASAMTGGLAGTVISSADIAAKTYVGAIDQYYQDKLSKGEEPNYEEAKKYAGTVSGVNATLMLPLGMGGQAISNMISKEVSPIAAKGMKDFLLTTVKDVGSEVAKSTARGGSIGLAMNIANNTLAKQIADIDVKPMDGALKSMEGLALFEVAMSMITKVPKNIIARLPKATISKLEYTASFMPPQLMAEHINSVVKSGKMSEADGNALIAKLTKQRELRNQFTVPVSHEQSEALTPIQEQKQNLVNQAENATPVMKENLNGKIAELDEKMLLEVGEPLSRKELERLDILDNKEDKTEAEKQELKYLTDRRKKAADIAKRREEEAATQTPFIDKEIEEVKPLESDSPENKKWRTEEVKRIKSDPIGYANEKIAQLKRQQEDAPKDDRYTQGENENYVKYLQNKIDHYEGMKREAEAQKITEPKTETDAIQEKNELTLQEKRYGKQSPNENEFQERSQAKQGINREAEANNFGEDTKGRIRTALSWLEAFTGNNKEASRNKEEELVRQSEERKEREKSLVLGDNDRGGKEIRTQDGNGKDIGEKTNEGRDSPSQESQQLGQQGGEFGTNEPTSTFQTSRGGKKGGGKENIKTLSENDKRQVDDALRLLSEVSNNSKKAQGERALLDVLRKGLESEEKTNEIIDYITNKIQDYATISQRISKKILSRQREGVSQEGGERSGVGQGDKGKEVAGEGEAQKDIIKNEFTGTNVFYHGAKKAFDKFQKIIKSGQDKEETEQPIFLSEDKEFADANAVGKDAQTLEVNVKNGKYFDFRKDIFNKDGSLTPLGEKIRDAVDSGEINLEGTRFSDYDGDRVLSSKLSTGDYDFIERKAFIDWLKKEGYDGVFLKEHPSQKSTNLAVWNIDKLEIKKQREAEGEKTGEVVTEKVEPTVEQSAETVASLRDVELTMRRPEKNEIIFVPVDALLQKHAADQPSYDIQKSENRIKGRVEKAKEFIKNYIKDQRAINPKTGERMNTKVSFEPSVVDIDANGKISFEDGRHRVLAAKEMGLTEVPIEVPKEKAKAVEQSLKETPKSQVAPQIFDRAFEAIKQRKKMAERDKILDEYGDKADKAKFVFKNWDKIKENLKQRAKEYEIEFKGDC